MKRLFLTTSILVSLSGLPALADTVLDPMHGFCPGCIEVTQNGNNVTTIPALPGFSGQNYGFWLSTGPLTTPDTRLYFATPDNSAAGPVVTSGTINGAAFGPTSATLLSSLGQWTSGDLDTFLGSNLLGGAQPNNPIGNFLPFTHNTDPSATGYNLFELDLGSIKLAGKDDTSLMNLSSSGLPTGSMIFAFTELSQGNGSWTATASSGVLYDDSGQGCTTCQPAPEPNTLALLGGAGVAVLGLGLLRRHRA